MTLQLNFYMTLLYSYSQYFVLQMISTRNYISIMSIIVHSISEGNSCVNVSMQLPTLILGNITFSSKFTRGLHIVKYQ